MRRRRRGGNHTPPFLRANRARGKVVATRKGAGARNVIARRWFSLDANLYRILDSLRSSLDVQKFLQTISTFFVRLGSDESYARVRKSRMGTTSSHWVLEVCVRLLILVLLQDV
jgi:hypothetical protein